MIRKLLVDYYKFVAREKVAILETIERYGETHELKSELYDCENILLQGKIKGYYTEEQK